MRRKILILALSLGTFGGFASGFHSLRHNHGCGWRSSACERHAHDCGSANDAPRAE